jgi:hypothetical protein
MPNRQGEKSGSGVNINGNVDTGGGDIAGGDIRKRDVHQTHGLAGSDIKELFLPIYELIDQKKTLPVDDRDDLKVMIEEIQGEAQKGSDANETLIARHLRNIARMAPDILDVTLKTIANPVLGLAALAQKIANKAGSQEAGGDSVEKKDIPVNP